MPARHFCFVLLPFGTKRMRDGRVVDFDRLYQDVVAPAAADAGLETLRAESDLNPDTRSEQLVLCDCAIVDLTVADATLFYDVGLRCAVREAGTVVMAAGNGSQLPFDLSRLNALSYQLDSDGAPADARALRAVLARRLANVHTRVAQSSVLELVNGFKDIQRLKTDVFRDRVSYSETKKRELASAREKGADAVKAVEADLGDIASVESAIVIDLLLSYRAVKAWDRMIALVSRMSPPLAATVMVREQLGFALNRSGRSQEAEDVLRALIDERGPSSETCALLGRVYKDRWEANTKAGRHDEARHVLDKAIGAYLEGFEADSRDAYPGINAVTLMELRDPPDGRRDRLIPVVRYAVERRIASGQPDYWDFATLLELAVLGRHEQDAAAALEKSLARVRESWEPETTARNLSLIREARERRGERVPWANEAEAALEKRM